MDKSIEISEKVASDIYKLTMIKVACYEAGYDIRSMSAEDMEKIAAINWPDMWNSVKGFGSNMARSVKYNGSQILGGIKNLPKVINIAVKDPNFAKSSLLQTLRASDISSIQRGMLPGMLLDDATGGIGGSLLNVVDGLKFINRLGRNMKGFSEYGQKIKK